MISESAAKVSLICLKNVIASLDEVMQNEFVILMNERIQIFFEFVNFQFKIEEYHGTGSSAKNRKFSQ